MLQQTQAFLPLRYRFGRRDIHFLAFIHLAAAMIWMRRMSILPNSGALTKPRVATDAPRRPRRRPPVRRLGQGLREFPRLACMRSTKSPPVWLIVAASWTRWFRAISADVPAESPADELAQSRQVREERRHQGAAEASLGRRRAAVLPAVREGGPHRASGRVSADRM